MSWPGFPVPTRRCQWRECEGTFASDEALYDHLCSSAHFVPYTGRQLKCRWAACTVSTDGTLGKFRKHVITHTNWKPFECPVVGCTTRFRSQSSANQHVAKVHPDNELQLEYDLRCRWDGCTRTLDTPELLLAHLRADHPAHGGVCLWDTCEHTRRISQQNFSRHLQTHLRPFAGPARSCGRTFAVGHAHKSPTRLSHRGKKRGRSADAGPATNKRTKHYSSPREEMNEGSRASLLGKRRAWSAEEEDEDDGDATSSLTSQSSPEPEVQPHEQSIRSLEARLRAAEAQIKRLEQQMAVALTATGVNELGQERETYKNRASSSRVDDSGDRPQAAAHDADVVQDQQWGMWVTGEVGPM